MQTCIYRDENDKRCDKDAVVGNYCEDHKPRISTTTSSSLGSKGYGTEVAYSGIPDTKRETF
jgi:hypothetical protein